MNPARTNLIARLADRVHEELGPFLPDGSYALIDFPDYSNVGDSAIWLGHLTYFRKHLNRLPAYTCGQNDFSSDEMAKHCPEGPIFIQGGGNFGDIWPHHHHFRLEMMKRFPDRRIIQLPQSIHFNDKTALAETARAIAAHGDFILFVRDEPSLELAKSAFDCEVRLTPDMALCLGPLPRPVEPSTRILALLRTDAERRESGDHALPADTVVADWLEDELLSLRTAKLIGLASGAASGWSGQAARFSRQEHAARSRLKRGTKLLSQGATVVTDRLHSHILSLLLGIPHAVLDNSYGKLSRFITAWTGSAPDLFIARSLEEATAWAAARADNNEYLPEGSLHPMEVGS